MKCKTCGKECHYCTSCESDIWLYEGYCNQDCYMNSKEFKETNKKFQLFKSLISEEAMNHFWAMWDFGIFDEGPFSYSIDKIRGIDRANTIR